MTDSPPYSEKSLVKSVPTSTLPPLDFASWNNGVGDPDGWKWYGGQSQRYAVLLHNTAEEMGIKAGLASLELSVPNYEQSIWYYLVAFMTVDRGPIYLQNMAQAGGSPISSVLQARVEIGTPLKLSFLDEIMEYYSGFYVSNFGMEYTTIKTAEVEW